jgi:hypothetical protein|tara:strand:+ start:576 stop:836 length:261 start_codon:yes stop_codon:yes gene_type:complete
MKSNYKDPQHPFYADWQAFVEVAVRRPTRNAIELFNWGLEDYREVFEKDPPEELLNMFAVWAGIHSTWDDEFWDEMQAAIHGQENA